MFHKILNLFKPGTDDIAEEASADMDDSLDREAEEIINKPKFEIPNNSVQLCDKLIMKMVEALKPERYSGKEIKNIVLFVKDTGNDLAIASVLESPDFEEKLKLAFENASIQEAVNANWSFKMDSPPTDVATLSLGTGIYLEYSRTKKQQQRKARITAIRGVLESSSYILDSAVASRFNIGRGANPVLDTGMYHKNQIVIKEVEDASETDEIEELNLNKYVSRAHAGIFYNSQNNFVLKVLDGGCFISNNRTRIFREDVSPIDALNKSVEYELRHNDQIELGKNVILHFEIIE